MSSLSRRKTRSSPSPSRGKSKSPSRKASVVTPSSSKGKNAEPKQVAVASAWKKWWLRFFTTLAMIGAFLLVIFLGHWAVALLVFILSVQGYREIEQLALIKANVENQPVVHRLLNWYWFFVMSFFIHGHIFKSRFPHVLHDGNRSLSFLAHYHAFMSMLGFIIGVVWFVLRLEKGLYKAQFKQLAWNFMALLLIVLQSNFYIQVCFEGLFWFMFATSLVISNDCWAYIFGFFVGRTKLIELSPKKTWEGFLGGGLMTIVWGVFFCYVLAHFDMLVCPRTRVFDAHESCERHPVFVMKEYALPSALLDFLAAQGLALSRSSIWLYPIQIHSIVFTLFASVIAPFGGFFASGFKRAFKLKDFADTIPGHGGILDRMDCQFMMGTFTWVYLLTFIVWYPSVDFVLMQIRDMPIAKQELLFNQLQIVLGKK